MAYRKLFNQPYAGYKLAGRINFSLIPFLLLGQQYVQLSLQPILSRYKKEWIGRIHWLNSKTAAVSTFPKV